MKICFPKILWLSMMSYLYYRLNGVIWNGRRDQTKVRAYEIRILTHSIHSSFPFSTYLHRWKDGKCETILLISVLFHISYHISDIFCDKRWTGVVFMRSRGNYRHFVRVIHIVFYFWHDKCNGQPWLLAMLSDLFILYCFVGCYVYFHGLLTR